MSTENPNPQEEAAMRRELEEIARRLRQQGDHRGATLAENTANGSRKKVVDGYKRMNNADRTYTGSTGPTRQPGSQDFVVHKSHAAVGIVGLGAAVGLGLLGLRGEAQAATPTRIETANVRVEQAPRSGVLFDISTATPIAPTAPSPQLRGR